MYPRIRRHRHLLILPVFLLLLGLSFLRAPRAVLGSLPAPLGEFRDASVVQWEQGRAFLDDGSRFSPEEVVPSLTEGSALMFGEGLFTVRAGETELQGLSGAFHVTVRASAVTVAALTAPVLARSGSGMMLIPPGMQWRTQGAIATLEEGSTTWFADHTLKSIPTHFLREKLIALDQLYSPREEQVWEKMRSRGQLALVLKPLTLPQARERIEEHRSDAFLAQLQAAVRQGQTVRAALLLQDPELSALLALPQEREFFARIVVAAAEDLRLLTPLLQYLDRDPTLWLLAGLHPALRERIQATQAQPKLPAEETIVALLVLPQSDVLSKPLPAMLLEAWVERFKEAVWGRTDAAQLLQGFAVTLTDLAQRQWRQEYPQRALELTRALLVVAERYPTFLSGADRERLDRILRGDMVAIVPQEEVFEEMPKSEEEAQTSAFAPQEVERLAYELLRDSGALFTVETSITASAADTALVRGVIFSSAGGDHTYDCTLNVQTHEVSQIVKDGSMLPNALSLGAFVVWVGR